MCLLLVMSLKRLLVGSISLSEDSQPDEENGEEQSERQETENCQSTGRFGVFKGRLTMWKIQSFNFWQQVKVRSLVKVNQQRHEIKTLATFLHKESCKKTIKHYL